MAEAPPWTRCIAPGCVTIIPPRQMFTDAGPVWVRVSYCDKCETLRAAAAAAAARAPGDPGPKPAPVPCTTPGCSGKVELVLITAGSRRVWGCQDAVCPACAAAEETARATEIYENRLASSWLPKRYQGFRFDRVLVQREAESTEAFAARVAAAEVPHLGITRYNSAIAKDLRAWKPTGRSLFLTGPVGGGKTTLVAALLTQLMRADVDVMYLPESQLYDAVRAATAARQGTPVRDVPRLASRCGVLALDDLGTVENLAPWQRNVIEQVVCARYDANLPILITSNLRLSDVAQIHSERIASRLAEMCGRRQIELVGYDWRTGHQHVAPVAPAAPVPPAAPSPSLFAPPTWSTPDPARGSPALPPKVRDYKLAAAGERDDD